MALDLTEWVAIGGSLCSDTGQCQGGGCGVYGHEPGCTLDVLTDMQPDAAIALAASHNALIAEVRSLRARIAAADQLHRPTEWHLYATNDCPAEECDPDDFMHDDGHCATSTYAVCAECVDQWREGMGDWLDVTVDVPPEEVQWPCPTHTALHTSEENT